MLQCFLIPNAVPVENEDFLSRGVSEDQLWVERVDLPNEVGVYHWWVDSFEAADINEVPLLLSEEIHFVEDDLLSMR